MLLVCMFSRLTTGEPISVPFWDWSPLLPLLPVVLCVVVRPYELPSAPIQFGMFIGVPLVQLMFVWAVRSVRHCECVASELSRRHNLRTKTCRFNILI